MQPDEPRGGDLTPAACGDEGRRCSCECGVAGCWDHLSEDDCARDWIAWLERCEDELAEAGAWTPDPLEVACTCDFGGQDCYKHAAAGAPRSPRAVDDAARPPAAGAVP